MHDFFELATNLVLTPPVLLLFDAAHIILSCIEVRVDSMGPVVTRRHPLACLLSCFILSFAGGFISNFLLGLPILGELEDSSKVAMVFVFWYLIFHSPMDLFHRLVTTMIFKIPIVAFKEMGRARKISKGIALAASVFPNSVIVMLIIGTIKGAGSGFIRPIDRIIRGVWNPQTNEVLYPQFTTKLTFLSCCVLLAGKYQIISLPYPQLVFVVSLFLVYAKIAIMLLGLKDPLGPIENLLSICLIGRPEEAKSMSVEDSTNAVSPSTSGVMPALGSGTPSSTMHSGLSQRAKAD